MSKRPPPIPLTGRSRWGPVLFFACLGMFVVWLILAPGLPPSIRSVSPLAAGVPCAFRTFTGLPCAFCGGTRAVRSLIQGDLPRALYLNPLAVALTGAAAVLALLVFAEALAARHLVPRPGSRTRWILLALGFALLLSWNIWHASSALRTPKPELLNLAHPLVRWIQGSPM